MELLFESRIEVTRTAGRLRFVQCEPEVLAEPVLRPNGPTDGTGANIYGSVLRDGGIYRMWYQAWPADWDGHTVDYVGYAESNEGLSWHKPALGLVPDGPVGNNLSDLALHSPAVSIDPEAPAASRYRATGFSGPGRPGARPGLTEAGYYTAHSADGLHWELDGSAPRWRGSDVITSVYHPARRQIDVALKHNPHAGGMRRRSIWSATWAGDKVSEPGAALVPDAWDDACAVARGYHSGDYYGMGMMPASRGMVGFLWQFRHALPLTPGREFGVFGAVDVSLVYQPGPGEAWLHVHGRPDLLTHGRPAWTAGGIYTAANVVDAGDEQWLYFGGAQASHAWQLDENWQPDPGRIAAMRGAGRMAVGLARWRRDRLFGFRADPAGELDIDLGEVEGPSTLLLNYSAESRGSLRVELIDCPTYSLGEATPLTGDALAASMAWGCETVLPMLPGRRLTARVHLAEATLFAWEVHSLRR